MCLIRPTARDEEIQSLAEECAQVIADGGGEVFKVDHWQLRRLGYRVGGFTEGNYLLMQFSTAPGIPAELTRRFRLKDDVLRYLVVAETKRQTRAREAREAREAAAADEREAAAAAVAAVQESSDEAAEDLSAASTAEEEAVTADGTPSTPPETAAGDEPAVHEEAIGVPAASGEEADR